MYATSRFLNMPEIRGETSDLREVIDLYSDRAVLYAGGFSASSHYARLKDEVKIAAGTKFWMTAVIELPPDFYSQNQASFKLITAGDSVGVYRRIGLWIDSSQLPRLQSETKGSGLKVLWKGDKKLPTGKHSYAVEFVPSNVDGQALLRLYVDGAVWGESNSANYAGKEINRLIWGIDGAADQDTKRMTLTVWQIGFNDFVPTDPCAAKREQLTTATAALKNAETALNDAKSQLQVAEAKYHEAKVKFDEISVEMNGC